MKVHDLVKFRTLYKTKLYLFKVAENCNLTVTEILERFINKFIWDTAETIKFLYGEENKDEKTNNRRNR